MKQYQHQKFLLQCDYEKLEMGRFFQKMPIDTPLYLQDYNLFDYPVYRRKIPLSVLDRQIDTQRDFDAIAEKLKYVDKLYLVDDRKKIESPFVQRHALATKKAFLWHFLNAGIKCYIAQ
ncbi:hypothetical protein [Fibrobacter intestinalis]|uniref:Uncharacterized protein n=1 Tax=Fibrobacter intestinalis TaxID=28122 RepID=A0A1T4K8U7_9BACT|nr:MULTISPECIES: hypothetical protein [Fibrobacter]PBC74943.1 hypothetical protein BGW94_2620 [Fibrobacter sp. NR9]SJZ38868.1 hypothetical protein SAMN02745108_00360 [Fibrobacter intestinalis]